MSYCRSGPDSNIYLIASISGFLECLPQHNERDPDYDGPKYSFEDLKGASKEEASKMLQAGWRKFDQKGVHPEVDFPNWEYDEETKKFIKLETTSKGYELFMTHSRSEMIEHLKAHAAVGHKVPKRAIRRLQKEILEEGDTYGK